MRLGVLYNGLFVLMVCLCRRHLASVFRGLLLSQHAVSGFDTPEQLVFLWIHETERTYGDCLTCVEDVSKFRSLRMSRFEVPTLRMFGILRLQLPGEFVFLTFRGSRFQDF